MEVDSSFAGNYHLETDADFNGNNINYYPSNLASGGKDGMFVRIYNAEGNSWDGLFAFGSFSSKGITKIIQSPCSDSFFVVAKGDGYFVNANEPKQWEEIPLVPILDVRCSVEHELTVFVNDTEICAYGSQGLKWFSGRLSWHDLIVKELTSNEVVAEYWDVQNEEYSEVRVNLADGSSIGAAKAFQGSDV